MEDQPDGSRKRNPPQRCPRPLEDLPIPRHDQVGDGQSLVGSGHVEEKIKEEDDGVMEDLHEDLYEENMEESSNYKNPPQRCLRPLEYLPIPRQEQSGDIGEDTVPVKEECKEEDEEYGVMEDESDGQKDMMMSPQRCPRPLEDLPIPRQDQGEDLRDIKAEVKEEEKIEMLMRDDQSMKEREMMESPDVSRKRNPPQRCPRPLEDFPIPHQDQNEDLGGRNIVVKQEFIMADEEYGVMEEPNEGHTEQPRNATVKKPRKRNTPQRCPRKDLPIPRHDQNGDVGGCKTDIKEYKEEDEEYGGAKEPSEGHMDTYKDIKIEPPNNENPPQRCPCPLEDLPIPRQDQVSDGQSLVGSGRVEEKIKEEDDGAMEDLHKGFYEKNTEESSIYKNPPQRRPCPLEDPTIPRHDKNENLGGRNVVVKQEFIMADGQYGVMDLSRRLKNRYKNATTECPNNRNPPERCLQPRDSTREDLSNDQVNYEEGLEKAEDVFDVKVECKEEEETYKAADHYSTAELGMSNTVREEEDVNQEEDDSEQDETFPTTSKELQHVTHRTVKKKGDKTHSCECGKSYRTKAALTRHQRIQTTEKPFPCTECGKRFSQKTKLDIHWRTHTGERPFSCSECGKSFIDMTHLKAHQKFHTGENLHTCPECGKRFSKKSQLVVHQRYHTGERLRSCSECGRKFPPALLEVHLRYHTGEKPYKCSECGKRFIWNSQLIVHQRSHTGEKPYECSDCGLRFPWKGKLQMHQKIHTEGKPYSCPECGKAFLWKYDMEVHVKRHRGEKPFSCPECGKGFVTKSMLNQHEKKHFCGKLVLCPVECARCGLRFPSRDQLVQHYTLHFEEEALGAVS